MSKSFKILPLLLVASLTACNNLAKKSGVGYYFYTELSYSLYTDNANVVNKIKDLCKDIDNYSDPYEKRSVTNVYDINQTNEKIEIGMDLYYLLSTAKTAMQHAPNFNPLIGSLSDKWKESLGKDNPEPLSDTIIQEELAKINSSSYELNFDGDPLSSNMRTYKYYVQRTGEATLDLGAITKGFALDRICEVLRENKVTDYIIDCGSSSILLGTNEHTKSWNGKKETSFTVSLRDVPGTKFKAQDCVISSSGNDIQGVEIGGTMYSHIINPNTGSAVMENDAVIVITDVAKGYLGDALSTSLMMNTVEEIKEIEKAANAKTIVVKNKKIVYSHPDIEFVS